jgi:hypothetical protein
MKKSTMLLLVVGALGIWGAVTVPDDSDGYCDRRGCDLPAASWEDARCMELCHWHEGGLFG